MYIPAYCETMSGGGAIIWFLQKRCTRSCFSHTTYFLCWEAHTNAMKIVCNLKQATFWLGFASAAQCSAVQAGWTSDAAHSHSVVGCSDCIWLKDIRPREDNARCKTQRHFACVCCFRAFWIKRQFPGSSKKAQSICGPNQNVWLAYLALGSNTREINYKVASLPSQQDWNNQRKHLLCALLF